MEGSNGASNEIVKLSFNIPKDEAEELRRLADERRTTITQTLRSAIADEKFLRDQIAEDGKILLESKHGKLRELILP
jgi:hypothetical protein